jgi:predicted aspartyl protease
MVNATSFFLKKFLFLFTVLILLISFTAPAEAQFFKFTGKRKKITIPFKIVKNLLVIPIRIEGKGPFNFVVDTGVGIALITEPALADSLKVKNSRIVRIVGFGEGSELSAYVTPSIKLSLNSVTEGSMPVAILKEDAFDLSGYTGMPIHGLIGYELFSSFIVKVNYQLKTLVLYSYETAYILKKGTKVPITIEEHKPYVVSEIQMKSGTKVKAKLIIDTGAGHPLSLETNAGIPFELPSPHIPANLGVGLAGQIKGYIGRVSSLKLGKYEMKDVIASFPDYSDVASKVISINRNGNLGNSVLKRFNVVFDYNRELMYLKPNYTFKEPFEHDMSGIEFTSFGENYKRIFITRVEQGSAADEAGLSKEDEILAINFKSVEEMSVEEIDGLFKSRNDRSFLLDVRHKNSKDRDRVILTLKKRI